MPCCERSISGYCCALLCEIDLRILLCLVVRDRSQDSVVPCCERSISGYCCALLCEIDLRTTLRLDKVNCQLGQIFEKYDGRLGEPQSRHDAVVDLVVAKDDICPLQDRL